MSDYQKNNTYFAQIADGLEATGAVELAELGATNARAARRGIYFQADRAALYRINYCTRLCTRVLAPIKSFACPDAAAIYQAARSIDWLPFFSLEQTFAVFASTAGSSVPHSQFAGSETQRCGGRPIPGRIRQAAECRSENARPVD
jgi:putative N6-adenine-specific DNA methylase